MSIYSNAWFHRKIVEPQKRNKDGERWIVHRFPIKGGISLRDAMLKDMCRENSLFKSLIAREYAL